MSANIYWTPTSKPTGNDLGIASPQAFMNIMQKVFGSREPTLTREDIEVLKGMAAMHNNDMDTGNPYQKLVDALEKYDSIELEAEY